MRVGIPRETTQGERRVALVPETVAKLTAVPPMQPATDRRAWLARLAQLRERIATAKSGLSVEQILEEDRGD